MQKHLRLSVPLMLLFTVLNMMSQGIVHHFFRCVPPLYSPQDNKHA